MPNAKVNLRAIGRFRSQVMQESLSLVVLAFHRRRKTELEQIGFEIKRLKRN
jgi:hypothetical protein